MRSFNDTYTAWRALSEAEQGDDDTFAVLEAAERTLLRHEPRSIGQAARILEVILAEADPRCDGEDRKALSRVRKLLAHLSGDVAQAGQSTASRSQAA